VENSWSAKHGACPAGDPEIHHYVGEILYKGMTFTRYIILANLKLTKMVPLSLLKFIYWPQENVTVPAF
jgi:hypothetical protein